MWKVIWQVYPDKDLGLGDSEKSMETKNEISDKRKNEFLIQNKELYKELIAYDWTEEEANSIAGNIDRLINDIIPYQTPQSYAELLNM